MDRFVESFRNGRVAVTGLGIVSPLGATADEHWRRLIAGERATRWMPELMGSLSTSVPLHFGWRDWCGAPAILPEGLGDASTDIVSHMAAAAAREAVIDAGHAIENVSPERRGCVLGISKPEWVNRERMASQAGHFLDLHSPSLAVASTYDIRGPVLVPSAACATGLISLIRGVELIRSGECDVVLAGSSDHSLHVGYLAGYRRLGVLAPAGDDPASACRPYDRTRKGFTVGSGAAMLVLERWDRAVERGATIHAEWLGHAMAADALSMVDFDTTGETPGRVIRDALRRFQVPANEVDLVSLHGTATPVNDLCETSGVHRGLGDAATRVSCFSLKGSIGHLMGAAGSVETATLVMAMKSQVVPPTMNLWDRDPRCDLDYTPNEARVRPCQVGIKLTLGFGGACAAAVLRRV